MVKQGDLLAEIDPRPYEAALEQSEGAVRERPGAAGEAQADLGALPDACSSRIRSRSSRSTRRVARQAVQGTVKTDQAQVDLRSSI